MSDFECAKCLGKFNDFDEYENHKCLESSDVIILEVKYTMENGKFKCKLCSRLYANEKTFNKHACKGSNNVPSVNEPALVPTNNIELDTLKAEVNSSELNKSTKSFKCDNCNKSWITEKGLNNHKCKEGKQEAYEQICNDCKKTFKSEKKYTSHACKPKQSKGDYKCSQCNAEYKTEKGLENHKCIPKFNKTCDDCKKNYRTEKGFNDHKCEKLECDKCSKIFKNKMIYDKHIKANKCVITK
jgi:hypothetical protein